MFYVLWEYSDDERDCYELDDEFSEVVEHVRSALKYNDKPFRYVLVIEGEERLRVEPSFKETYGGK